MPHRSFTVDTEAREEGPSFDLAGESFQCIPAAPADALNQFLMAVSIGPDGEQVFHAPNLIRFMEAVLIDQRWEADDEGEGWVDADDVARFRALCRSKTTIVTIENLGEVVIWLVETYTGRRPT